MARIERFTSRAQADMACGMLRANGFDARVSGDDAGGVHPDIPFGIGGTAVIVPDDELEGAVELLDEHGLTDAPPDRDVPRADEADESQPRWGLRAAVVVVLVVLIVAAVVTATST